jgi:hypothetical protein
VGRSVRVNLPRLFAQWAGVGLLAAGAFRMLAREDSR